MIKSHNKESNAALAVVIRIWIVSLALLAVPALGAYIFSLSQCRDAVCTSASSQSARYIAR
jgi:hypothetical protein